MNSFVSMRSSPERPRHRGRPERHLSDLKRCASHYGAMGDVAGAVERSRKALVSLQALRERMASYRELFIAVNAIRQLK